MYREQKQRDAWQAADHPAPPGAGEVERLFREHHAMVFRAAWRITGNAADAEDVLQTVFLRLVRREQDAGALVDSAGEAVAGGEGYLRRSAVNAALDVVRSRQAVRAVPVEDAAPLRASEADSPERVRAGAEMRVWLRAAVARMSPQAAEIFALRFFEGKENAEIAGLVGTTPGTVAVTLHRARQRLLEEFQQWREGRDEA